MCNCTCCSTRRCLETEAARRTGAFAEGAIVLPEAVDEGPQAGSPGVLHVDLERAIRIEAATSLNTTLLKIRVDVTEGEFDPSDSALVAIQLGVAREHALALAEELAELLETKSAR